MAFGSGLAASGEASRDLEARIARVEAGLLPKVLWKDRPVEPWRLDDRMRHYRAPAVSLAVLDDFELAWARAWGLMNTDGGGQVTAETLFQVGSISKPVSALLTLRIVAEGALDLNEPINQRLTSWKLEDSAAGGSAPVLLRHVLSHAAGIADFTLPAYAPGEQYPGVLALLQNRADRPLPPVVRVRPPAARFEYSNPGYAVLEQLLEDVSGRAFDQLAQGKLFEPLEMQGSSFSRELPGPLYHRAAWGHQGEERTPIAGKGLFPPAAVGGLWTTPSDLCLLLRELMLAYRGENDRWFPPELAREMLSDQIDGQGLGVRLRGEGRSRYFLHGGGMPGFVALLVAFPETGQGAVVAINGDAYPLLGEVLRAVAAEYDWPGYLPEFEIQQLPDEQFARFEGRYAFDRAGGLEMEISRRGGRYYRGRAEMVPVGEGVFVVTELDDMVEFLVAADGSARAFRYGEHGINQAWAWRMPADLPERASVDGEVARGVVRKSVEPFGNLETNLTADDLQSLGIEPGELFEVRVGEQRLRAALVAGFAEAEAGEWAMIAGQSGRLELGRRGANATAELGAEAGAPIEIRPIGPRGDQGPQS